jgi:hypothetical protein
MLAPENPEYVGLLEPQTYLKSNGFFESTAGVNPAYRADAVAKSLELTRTQNMTAAGFLENQKGYSAMMNSKGLFAYYPSTSVNFSLTVRTPDGKGSGYVDPKVISDFSKAGYGFGYQDCGIQKCQRFGGCEARWSRENTRLFWSRRRPSCSCSKTYSSISACDARSADEGRSFLSKPGGKTKLGEKDCG